MRRLLVLLLVLWASSAQAQTIVKSVNLFNGGQGDGANRAATSYAFPQYAPAYLYTAADWNPAPTIYFEAVLAMTAGGGTAYAELYNNTDGATVSSSELTSTSATAERLRSGALTLTTAKDYKVRIKSSAGTVTARIYAARLIFVQTGTIVATETVWDFGGEDTTTGTSYADTAQHGRYYHDTNFLDGTVATYFEANISPSVSGSTARAQLHDGTSAVTSSEVTLTGTTTDTRVRSSAITLSHGSTYKIQDAVDSNTGRTRGARIIILQTATPTKTVSFYAIKTSRQTANNTGLVRTSKRLWDEDEWSVGDTDIYHEGWASTSSGVDTATTSITNSLGTVNSITSTAATPTRQISGELALTDNDELDGHVANSDGSSATFFGQYLRIEVDIGEAAPAGTSPRMLLLGVGEP
jgi:hypothetical protein